MPWITLPSALTRGQRGDYISVFSAFMITVLCGGPFLCFGVLFVPIREEIGGSATEIGWVGSLPLGIASISAPIRLFLCGRFSHRSVALAGVLMCVTGLIASSFARAIWVLFPCYSIMCGFGCSFAHIGGLTLVDKLFTGRQNAIATTLVCFGMGIGTVCFGPLFEVLQVMMGLRNTLRILAAGQACIGIPLCLVLATTPVDPLLKLQPTSKDYLKQMTTSLTDPRLWKEPLLVLWVFGCLVWFMSLCFPYVHLISYVENVVPDVTTARVAMITAAMGCGEIGSRVLVILACWYLPWPQCYLYPVVCAIAASWNFILPHLTDNAGFLIYATCSGMCYGFSSPGLYRTNLDLFGQELYESAYAINLLLLGVGTIVGPVIAGAIYDDSGSYETAFFMSAGASIVAAVAFMAMVTIHRGRAQVLEYHHTRRKSSTSTPLVDESSSSRRTSTETSTDSAIDMHSSENPESENTRSYSGDDIDDEEVDGLLV